MQLPAPQPFMLELRWLQAQAFRWCEGEDGWYYGFVKGHLIKVRNSGDGIEFRSEGSEESLAADVKCYFRLDQDIKQVHDALRRDDKLSGLVDEYGGMRILRQDPWECLIAYICSQNNNIERITAIVNDLAGRYGEPLTLDDMTCHSFPSPERLAEVGEKELEGLRLGLSREKRILAFARDVDGGNLDLDALTRLPYRLVRGGLMSYEGIGPKIADCVCLFSLGKDEAFPVDRHIENGLKAHYEKSYTAGAKNARLLQWIRDKFGSNAGYAGQLLFLDQLRKAEKAT